MRRRNAFTILEVLVMSVIGLTLIAVSWFVFSGLTKQSKKLDTRLRAIQASQLILERIKQDVRQYVHREDWSMVDASPPRLSIPVFQDYVFDRSLDAQRAIKVDAVNWIFNAETHYLTRNTEVMKFAQFETVQFSAKSISSGAKEFTNSVTIEGVYVPEELLGNPGAISDNERIRWSATIGLPALTQREVFGFYLQNPPDVPSF